MPAPVWSACVLVAGMAVGVTSTPAAHGKSHILFLMADEMVGCQLYRDDAHWQPCGTLPYILTVSIT